MSDLRPGTRQYYLHQKALAEAAIGRKLDQIHAERMTELMQQAAKEGIASAGEFRAWLDRPAVVVGGATELCSYMDDEGHPTTLTQKGRIVSRRQALNLELRALRQTMLAKEGYGDPFVGSQLETKSAPVAVKVSRAGTISGYLSAYGNVDLAGDIVMPGAFKECLARRRRKGESVPILWQHDPARPIGKWNDLKEDARGLHGVGRIDDNIEDGKRALSGIREGYLKGLSIGYRTLKEDNDHQGRRRLHELELMEASVVTFPANDQATIISVE